MPFAFTLEWFWGGWVCRKGIRGREAGGERRRYVLRGLGGGGEVRADMELDGVEGCFL